MDVSSDLAGETKKRKVSEDEDVRNLKHSPVSEVEEETSKINEREQEPSLHTAAEEIGPLFSIRFRNQDVARKYRSSAKRFFKQLIYENDSNAEECSSSDLELDIWEEAVEEQDESDLDLFVVDTCPTTKDDLARPSYNKDCRVLKEEEVATDITKKGPDQSCFNCLGSHTLRDCTEPRNHNAISRNKRDFTSKQRTHGYQRYNRYHIDEEQKFSGFTPGMISKTLRRALGLKHNELPRHIYRMRLLGYPPGWLEDAKVSHSGVSMFDSQGKEVADPDDEEGEIIPEGSKDKYNVNKIISYPGFNAPCNDGTIDDYEYYRCPPMSSEQSKEAMLTQLNPVTGYKKKKLSPITAAAEKLPGESVEPADMEIDASGRDDSEVRLLSADDNCRFIPPLPRDNPPPPPPPLSESDVEGSESRSQGVDSPLSLDHSSVMSSPRGQSPSLSDLETKKRLLLAELEDGGSSSDAPPHPRVTPTSSPKLGQTKNLDLGTPVLDSRSPFNRLPAPQRFSKDICDVLNFENLPDTTGHWQRLSGFIRKVTNKIRSGEDEKSN